MRFIKILVILVFTASLTNINICQKASFSKNFPVSENRQLIISGFENAVLPLIFNRNNQVSKKTNLTGLPKLILTVSTKSKHLYISHCVPIYASIDNSNEYSLISLHCLLTI